MLLSGTKIKIECPLKDTSTKNITVSKVNNIHVSRSGHDLLEKRTSIEQLHGLDCYHYVSVGFFTN